MAAPAAIVEKMLDSFGIQDFGQTDRFMPRVIPLPCADDDPHVIEFPRVRNVGQVMVRTIEIDVIVVITIEERADVERSAK